jgi:hypothetical protein
VPLITVEVTQSTLAVLNRRARDKGCGLKAEQVAADIIEHDTRHAVDLDRKFRDAASAVDKRHGTG